MTERAWKKLDTVRRIERGELTVGEAAKVLGLSPWQVRRLRRRVEKHGNKGVVHGNQGRPSPQRTKRSVMRRVVSLAKVKYRGFNDQHLTEKLMENERIELKPFVGASNFAEGGCRRQRESADHPGTGGGATESHRRG